MDSGITAESEMRTAAAMLALGGLTERDIASALRVDVGQVTSWLSSPAHTSC